MHLKKTLGAALLSGFVALGAVAPAQAAVYVGRWDPAYGPAFPNVGWRATAELYVPDTCLAAVGAGPLSLDGDTFAGTTDCDLIELQDTRLYFYDLAAPLIDLDELIIGVYTAAPDNTSNGLSENQLLTSVDFNGGEVVGFNTSASVRLPTVATLNGLNAYEFSLVLSLDPLQSRVIHTSAPAQTLAEAVALVQFSQNPPRVQFSRVPEPGTFALALAGLALALTVRRSRA